MHNLLNIHTGSQATDIVQKKIEILLETLCSMELF